MTYQVATPGHAVYAPSSAHRWTVCTASAEAISKLGEQEEGEEAAEGTRAHDEIERVLGPYSGDGLGLWLERNDTMIHPINGNHPAAYGVALVLAYVRGLIPGTLWIEQRVRLTDQIWGRCDVAHWDETTATLTIVDYKNGQRAVDVEENEQLRIYAAASMRTHSIAPVWIRYVIVQPNDWRPFVPRVKQAVEPVADLHAWVATVEKIPSGPLEFVAGDHCRNCPLFAECDASRDALANIAPLFSGLVQPENVRPEQVAKFLAMRKPIEDTFKTFVKYWEKRALDGDVPSGMKIVTGVKHRAWKNEHEARAAIFAAKGLDALSAPTPSQAEEMGINIEGLADKPQGGPALAFGSDKRKPWVARTSADMFAGIPGLAPTASK